jgi:hypothetical protein
MVKKEVFEWIINKQKIIELKRDVIVNPETFYQKKFSFRYGLIP